MATKNPKRICLCEICNCGRHKCPHKHKLTGSYDAGGMSEYTDQYIQRPIQPVGSYKPTQEAVKSMDPLSDQTTHRSDYVSHPTGRPHFHQAETYRAPEGSFDDSTVYKNDYNLKKGERQAPVKREAQRSVLGKFEGEPTYKNDYKAWQLPPREWAHRTVQWNPPNETFGGVPTYQTDYIAYKSTPRISFKPPPNVLPPGRSFDSATDYRQSYVAHQVERHQPKEKMIWHPPTGSFDSTTTFRRDYTPKDGGKANSCKPASEAYASTAPLQSDTTHRLDYKPWEVAKPLVHQPDAYRAPEGDMATATTYAADFLPQPFAKLPPIKPQEHRHANGSFDSHTDYRDNYKSWNAPRRALMGPRRDYQAPNIPFEGESTHQAHYIAHASSPRVPFKPAASQSGLNDGRQLPFDDGTIYRLEYTQKPIEVCPAVTVDTDRSGYVFKGKDDNGHNYYEQKSAVPTVNGNVGGGLLGNGGAPPVVAVY